MLGENHRKGSISFFYRNIETVAGVLNLFYVDHFYCIEIFGLYSLCIYAIGREGVFSFE